MNRFFPNRSGIKALGRSTLVGEAIHKDAESIADEVRRVAPVDTGAYRDSIIVQDTEQDGLKVAIVSAGVPYASLVEFGTSDTPTFAPLRRGAEAAGFRLRA